MDGIYILLSLKIVKHCEKQFCWPWISSHHNSKQMHFPLACYYVLYHSASVCCESPTFWCLKRWNFFLYSVKLKYHWHLYHKRFECLLHLRTLFFSYDSPAKLQYATNCLRPCKHIESYVYGRGLGPKQEKKKILQEKDFHLSFHLTF